MQIIFEDKAILVINKPSGVLSIADGYDKTAPYLRSILEPEYGRLWIVHRLDKETSGVMILAKSASSHRVLNQQFSEHLIEKQYAALAFGHCPDRFQNASSLRINGDRRHRTVVDLQKGKAALTEFALVEYFDSGFSLISAFPKTGFSHQIRAHLLHLGYPILGDHLYCTPDSECLSNNFKIGRVALHAYSVTFLHPETQKKTTFSADIPPDFSSWIDTFNKKRASV
mgnify:CR=1 FL=1